MGKFRAHTCVLVIAILSIAAAGTADAAPVKTNLFGLDGLFMATYGTTLPAGTLVASASMLIVSDDNVDASTLPVSVTYGASDRVEVAAAYEVYKSFDNGAGVDDSGTGDLYLSGKYALQAETADYPATALGLRLKIPVADAPLGTEETDFAIFAAVDTDMRGVRGVLNIEYLLPGGDAENQVNYVVGVEIPFSDATDFTLELMDQPQVGDLFAAGATFDMGSSLNFGVAVGFGLNDPSADFAAIGKLAFSF
ncbi:MAG: hypothetical protein JSV00_01275 [bacterium]|nr:MAG: hypothetical protein JSV00_01275 [bacterium]